MTTKNLQRIFDGIECPRCEDKSKATTTDLHNGAFIRACNSCNWSIGVDDSVNLCDLGGENWEFEPIETSTDAGFCLENESHSPIFIGSTKNGLMKSRCSKCTKFGIMFYNGKISDSDIGRDSGDFHDLESLFTTIFNDVNITSAKNAEDAEDVALLSDLKKEFENIDEIIPDLSQYPFTNQPEFKETVCVCDCGNNQMELFEKIINDSTEELRCLNCDARYSAEKPASFVYCEKCKNDSEECFEKQYLHGELVQIKCFQCDSVFKFSGKRKAFDESDYLHKVIVTSWDMIEAGNHISWQRALAYEHHAIITAVNPGERRIFVIEYGSGMPDKVQPYVGRVQKNEEIITDFNKIFLYRYDYDPEKCFPSEEVIKRARSRIGESQYDIWKENCEHFATWCKTGSKFCSQNKPFLDRAYLTIVRVFQGLSSIMIQKIKKHLLRVIVGGLDDVACEAELKAIACDAGGRIAFTFVINLALELISFIYHYRKAKKDFDEGRITRVEFRKRTFELIGEHSGGLILGFLLGLAWLFGIGIVGTLLLNFGGIAAGRILGSMGGRKLHQLTSETNTF